MEHPLAVEVADKGHAILNPIGNGDAGRSWDLTVELAYPLNVGKKIAALKGSLHLVVPSKLETLEVPIGDLQPGMTVLQEIRTRKGALLVPKGFEVTTGFLERVANWTAAPSRPWLPSRSNCWKRAHGRVLRKRSFRP